jgi:hypothetical protein
MTFGILRGSTVRTVVPHPDKNVTERRVYDLSAGPFRPMNTSKEFTMVRGDTLVFGATVQLSTQLCYTGDLLCFSPAYGSSEYRPAICADGLEHELRQQLLETA